MTELTAIDTLSGCRAKLQRAETLLSELGDVLMSYLMRDPFLPIVEPLPGGVEVIVRAHDQGLGGPPVELTLRAGEIAHQLRSILDHLVYGLVKKAGAKVTRQTGFPIFQHAAKFSSDAPAKIAGLSTTARVIIETLQPFHAAAPEEAPLSILQRLNNMDKHRLIPVTTTSGGWLMVNFPGHGTGQVHAISKGILSDGMELSRIALPTAGASAVAWFGVTVVIARLGAATNVALLPSLTALMKDVTAIVNELAPEF